VEAARHVGARLRPQFPPCERSLLLLDAVQSAGFIALGFQGLASRFDFFDLLALGAVGVPAITEHCGGVHCRGAGGRDHNAQCHSG
jgi:hypothetical protein